MKIKLLYFLRDQGMWLRLEFEEIESTMFFFLEIFIIFLGVREAYEAFFLFLFTKCLIILF